MNGLLVGRDLNPFDFFEFLYAGLHLPGLGGLVAEAVNEGLQLLDALALIAVGGFKLRASLVFLPQVGIVVAAVKLHALVPDLDRAIDRDIQKIAVVRNQHVGVGVIGEV